MSAKKQTVRVLSANVRGLANHKKLVDVINYLNGQNPNIICLQDTHLTQKNSYELSLLFEGEIIIHGHQTNARGIAVLIKNNFDVTIEQVNKTVENILTIDLKTYDMTVRLIVIYGPNTDSPAFFEHLESEIENHAQDYAVICGDFNLVLNTELDSDNYMHINNPRARNKFLETIDTYNLVDVYRHLHTDSKHYTWRRKNPTKQARLDYFIINRSMCDLVDSCKIKPSYKSDHSVIELNLIVSNFLRYKGRWHFNASLLKDPEYLTIINEAIDDEMKKYVDPRNFNVEQTTSYIHSPDIVLELIIMRCRVETMKFSRKRKNQQASREKKLLNSIDTLEKSGVNSPELDLAKQELEELREVTLKGYLVRCRTLHLQEYEKPSSYFLALEKQKYIDKTIKKIVKTNGEILYDQVMILNEIKHFYEELFRNHDIEENLEKFDETFFELNLTKLSPKQAEQLDLPISESEIGETLKKMKNFKTAGIDGFGAEFYKVFWSRLKTIITQAFQYSYAMGRLSVTLRHSILICLPKGDKPRQYLKNWRPLSMLSVLYKLISGTMANRLKKILNFIISKNQSAFIENRFIGDNTRLIYDVIHTTEKRNLPALLMSIDFEKAFDSLSWKFLYNTLKLFGFGDSFISWIKTFNNDIFGYVIQSGLFSEKFRIQRGCRQGDPISPYLFILATELLFQLIDSNPNIKGINIDGFEIKMAQFADDTTLLLDGSLLTLQTALNTIEIFGSLSGLRMNSEKTKVIWLGSKKYSRDKLVTDHNLQWGLTNFDLLGIKFDICLSKMIDINLKNAMQQIKNQITNWNRRNLTPIGKIVIIKSLFISKINHILATLPIPNKKFLTELQTILYKFLWDNKPDKVKRKIINEPIKNGGLNMPDLNKLMLSIKTSWFRRLIKSSEQDWITIFEKTICDKKNLTVYGMDYLLHLKQTCTNPFWQDVFKAFYLVNKSSNPTCFQDLLDTPLWFNTNVFSTRLHYPNWSRSELYFIRDIVDENGNILDYNLLNRIANVNIIEYINTKIHVSKYIQKFTFETNEIQTFYPTIPFHLILLFKSKKGNSVFMKAQKNNKKIVATAVLKWHEKLNFTLNSKTWESIFYLNYNTIRDNYYIYFNYRILHRILGTNHLMYKMQISQTENCRLCENASETLIHLFLSCPKSIIFWKTIFAWIKNLTKVSLAIDVTIIFGYLISNSYSKAINTILMVAKNYIFQMARSENDLFLYIFKKKLIKIYHEQRNLAVSNNLLVNFDKAWIKFQPMLLDIENPQL